LYKRRRRTRRKRRRRRMSRKSWKRKRKGLESRGMLDSNKKNEEIKGE